MNTEAQTKCVIVASEVSHFVIIQMSFFVGFEELRRFVHQPHSRSAIERLDEIILLVI